jgi:RimJ/RimL family protein N-acetyltransferase
MIKIETKRQYLMELSEKNLPDLRAMLRDAQTMYAWEGALSEAEIQEWYEKQLSSYEYRKYGVWAAVLQKNIKFAGYCGLNRENIEGLDVLGLAYVYSRDYWHKGYACEAAKSCVRYAFEGLGYSEVFAVVRDTNISSMNVAIRSGMVARQRIIRHYRGIDMPHIVFSIKRDAKPQR